MSVSGNQPIFGLRMTIFACGGNVREGSEVALTVRFADGYEASFPLNDGCPWAMGSTHQVTITLPDSPLAKDIQAIGVSFVSAPGRPHDDWVMAAFDMEARVDGETWVACVDGWRSPHVQPFTKRVDQWSTAFVYTSEFASTATRATIQRSAMRGPAPLRQREPADGARVTVAARGFASSS
jgi:hypothetical protein